MRINGKQKLRLCYGAIVLLPLALTLIYLITFAQDRYQSVSVLLVKKVADTAAVEANGLSALLGVANTSSEDSNILKEYIRSRDMVEKLDQQLNLRAAFIQTGDPIFSLAEDATVEDLVDYFNQRVKVDLDEKTMMLNVASEGFSPAFSLRLNQAILEQSDHFINGISNSIALEQQKFAQHQLTEATTQLKQARDNLLQYQNQHRSFDPELQAKAVATLVVGLQSNLAQLSTEERTLLAYLNPESAQVVALRSQIEALKKQIHEENAKLTSASNAKLNKEVADFEALKAQVTFSSDLYKLSLASLEKSRLEASKKLKKLVVIAAPRLAEDAVYPRRVYISITTFILLNIVFGIGLLIHSIIREHRE